MIKYEAERIDVAVIGAGHAGLEAIRQSAVRERDILFLK